MIPLPIKRTHILCATPERAKEVLDEYGEDHDYTFIIDEDTGQQHAGVIADDKYRKAQAEGSRWLIAAVVGPQGDTRFVPTVIGNPSGNLYRDEPEGEEDCEDANSLLNAVRLDFALNGITFIG